MVGSVPLLGLVLGSRRVQQQRSEEVLGFGRIHVRLQLAHHDLEILLERLGHRLRDLVHRVVRRVEPHGVLEDEANILDDPKHARKLTVVEGGQDRSQIHRPPDDIQVRGKVQRHGIHRPVEVRDGALPLHHAREDVPQHRQGAVLLRRLLPPLELRVEAADLLQPVVAVEDRRARWHLPRPGLVCPVGLLGRQGDARRIRLGNPLKRRPARLLPLALSLPALAGPHAAGLLHRALLILGDRQACEMPIIELVHRRDDAERLPSPEELAIPLREPLLGGRPLVRGVAPEDEVVSPLRRARPDVCPLEPSQPRPEEVRRQNLVVHLRARRPRSEVLDGVEIRDVHAPLAGVRRRRPRRPRSPVSDAVFLHVQAELANVHAVYPLKGQQVLRHEGDVCRDGSAPSEPEAVAHHLRHRELGLRLAHDPNVDRRRDVREAQLGETLADAALDDLGHDAARQSFRAPLLADAEALGRLRLVLGVAGALRGRLRHVRGAHVHVAGRLAHHLGGLAQLDSDLHGLRHRLAHPGPSSDARRREDAAVVVLAQLAERAEEAGVRVLEDGGPRIEERADLVHPLLAAVALHPGLADFFVKAPLQQAPLELEPALLRW
mmetsp:Transcript_1626/g.7071  ORF Transcript_1626/g.7071 Transcript_1626/m.7071 type:complete len:607 (-) Transcript_1626:723-2543(-)